MSDRGYTIGLLIGCVLLLSAGLAFTLFELNEYKKGVSDPLEDISVRTTTPRAEPEPEEEPVVDDELEEPDEETEEDAEDAGEEMPEQETGDMDEPEENGEPNGDDPDDNDLEIDDN